MKRNGTRLMGALILVALLGLALFTAYAEPPPLVGFAGTGTGTSTGTSNFICSANCANGGVVRILYAAATGGNADNIANIYGPTETGTLAVNSVKDTYKIPVVATNGFAAGDLIVVRHRSTDTYDFRILDTMAESTNLVCTVAPTTTAAGDVVYKMEAVSKLTVGSAAVGSPTIVNAPSGFFIAKRPGPVALIISGTSVANLGWVTVSGDYVKP